MRRAGMGTLSLVGAWMYGACTADDAPLAHPELRVDVEIEGETIWLSVLEVARPDACPNLGFPTIGTCAPRSDVGCGGDRPGSWLVWARVVAHGEEVASASLESWAQPYFLPVAGGVPAEAVLQIGYDDGGSIAVPLPRELRPRPTASIESLTRVNDEELEVRWDTWPVLPHAVVSFETGLGGDRCHVAGVSTMRLRVARQPPGIANEVRLSAFPSPTITPTAAGLVYVWQRTSVTTPYVDDPP